MRRSLAPYAVIVACLAIALVVIVAGTAPPAQDDDPSSRVAGKAGTLALYTWLDRLGFRVHRITGQFDTSGSDVILILDPRTPFSDADAQAVMAALAAGSDVVLDISATGPGTAGALLDRLRISAEVARPAGDASAAQPIDVAGRVHHVPMAPGVSIDPAPYLTPLLTQSGALAGVAEQVGGAGRAYVLASNLPLSNDGLRDEDSAALVLSFLERARGGSIGFDEYHHGESQAVPDGAAAIFESPLGLALALAVVVLVVHLALSGRRLGPPLPAGAASTVPSTATYISAMAALLGRSREQGAVATRLADDLRRRLGAAVGVDPSIDDETFAAAVERLRPGLGPEVSAVLGRARALAGSRPDSGRLLALARELDAVEARAAQPAVPAPAQSAR